MSFTKEDRELIKEIVKQTELENKAFTEDDGYNNFFICKEDKNGIYVD